MQTRTSSVNKPLIVHWCIAEYIISMHEQRKSTVYILKLRHRLHPVWHYVSGDDGILALIYVYSQPTHPLYVLRFINKLFDANVTLWTTNP